MGRPTMTRGSFGVVAGWQDGNRRQFAGYFRPMALVDTPRTTSPSLDIVTSDYSVNNRPIRDLR